MKMSPKSILGDGGLSQDATSGDATIWNFRRKEPSSNNIKDATASNQAFKRITMYRVFEFTAMTCHKERKWMKGKKG